MGQIYLYNSLDAKKNIIRASGKLRDILPEYDFSKAVALNNGNRIDPDFIVGEKDSVFIRAVPQGATLTVVAIVVSVIAAGAAIGTAIYSAIQNQRLQDQLNKAQKQANADRSVNELPFLKGAKNRSALGNDIQYVMGEMFNTPYSLYAGHYSLSGENGSEQYWNAILCAGYSGQVIKSVSIGDVKVLDRSEDTAPQNGVYEVTEGIYAAPENRVEIRNVGEFETEDFRQKVIAVSCSDEIAFKKEDENPNPVVKQLESNCMAVDVEIEFNGLRSMDGNGNWNPCTVNVVPYWTNDNGETWNEFSFSQNGTLSNEFTYNSSKTIRFVAHKDFTPAESFGKSIQIKLERKTRETGSGRQQDTARCGYFQTYCYDAKQSSMTSLVPCRALTDQFRDCTTRIGLRFIANESTSGELDEINVMSCGIARTWNGSAWSTKKSITRNPASWILEILTSSTHVHSRYSDAELDLDSFGALYEYCEEQELFCDGIITKGSKKRDVIGKILEECFSTLIINRYGKLEVCIDREETMPVALINSQSIISSTVTKNFERQIDGKKATFVNRNNWQPDTMYVMRDGSMTKRPEQSATEFSMSYATTPEHTFKFIQRQLLKASLQPREVKVNVGKEGDYYPLYSTVKVQMPQMRVGNVSTVIHAIDLEERKVTVADAVTFENGKSYGLIIEGVTDRGRKEGNIRVEGTGTTNVLDIPAEYDTSAIDLDFIEYGNIASFGELVNGSFSKVTNVMKIMGINTSEEGVSLTLRDYNPDIYEWEKGRPVPEFKSNLTSVAINTPPSMAGVSYAELQESMELSNEAARRNTAARIEAAQIKGSPMYSANIDTAVVKKISASNYSPSSIGCKSFKTYFDDDGTPSMEPNASDWVVTVNGQYEVVYENRFELVLNINELLEQIRLGRAQTTVDLKNIRIVSRSTNNPEVEWDNEYILVIANDGGYVFDLENDFQVYECYSDIDGVSYEKGYIKQARTVEVIPHLYQGLQSLNYGTDWEYGVIPLTEGIITRKRPDGVLEVTALEGADLAESGSMQIPVFIRSSKNLEVTIGYDDVAVGYTDNAGVIHTIGYTEAGEDTGEVILSFGWKKLTDTALRLAKSENFAEDIASDNKVTPAEKKFLAMTMDQIRTEFETYSRFYSDCVSYPEYLASYNAWKTYTDGLLADMTTTDSINREVFTELYEAYCEGKTRLETEFSANPTYSMVDSYEQIPFNPKRGDYFLCNFDSEQYSKGMIYSFNGEGWRLDNSPEKIMATMDDALSILSNARDTNIPAVAFCQKLVAMNAVIKNLATQVITLSQKGKIVSDTRDEEGNPLTLIDAEGNIKMMGNVEIGKSESGIVLTPEGKVIVKGSIESVDCQITGNSFFGGDIESGPLVLKSTGGMDLQINIPKGTRIPDTILKMKDSYKAYTGVDIGVPFKVYNGFYGNRVLTSIDYDYDGSYSELYLYGPDWKLKLYGRTDKNIDANLSFNFFSGSEKEFRLIDLPESNPGKPGMVWNDRGTLKIS